MARKSTEVTSPSAAARRAQAIPYFAQKMPHDVIAKLFRVSEATVRKWSSHPDVRRALGKVEEHVLEQTKANAGQLVDTAWATLRDIMTSGGDEKARVQAAMTTLSRLGVPERKENAHEVSAPGGGPAVVGVLYPDVATATAVARAAARKSGGEG